MSVILIPRRHHRGIDLLPMGADPGVVPLGGGGGRLHPDRDEASSVML